MSRVRPSLQVAADCARSAAQRALLPLHVELSAIDGDGAVALGAASPDKHVPFPIAVRTTRGRPTKPYERIG